MMLRSTLALGLLVLHTVTAPAEAAIYFDNVRIRGNTTQPLNFFAPGTTYTYPSTQSFPPARPTTTVRTYSDSNCLYRNPQGECMIQQFFDQRTPTYENRDKIRYNTVYNRKYLYNERRYSNRDDDSDDDDIYDYRYYEDDDDSYSDDDSNFSDDDDSFSDDDDDSSSVDDDDDDSSDDDNSDDDDSSSDDDDDGDDDSGNSDDDDGKSGDDEDDEDDSSDEDHDESNDDEDDNDN